jgi:ketosteroid isomerase-like protein
MSADENKAILRRFVDEVFNRGDLTAIDTLVAPDYTAHLEGLPFALPTGPECWGRRVAILRTAFPDMYTTIEDLLAVDDKVVVRYRCRGTHRGAFWGIAPTGNPISYTGIMILRLRDGQLAEEWSEADLLGLTRQLAPPAGSG